MVIFLKSLPSSSSSFFIWLSRLSFLAAISWCGPAILPIFKTICLHCSLHWFNFFGVSVLLVLNKTPFLENVGKKFVRNYMGNFLESSSNLQDNLLALFPLSICFNNDIQDPASWQQQVYIRESRNEVQYRWCLFHAISHSLTNCWVGDRCTSGCCSWACNKCILRCRQDNPEPCDSSDKMKGPSSLSVSGIIRIGGAF